MTDSTQADSVASRNVATVYVYLRLLEEKDIDSWIELWAENANHYYPFGTEMFPPHLVGKAAIFDRWKDTPAMFESLSFPIRATWTDGDTVIARFDSDSVLKGGTKYLNTYLCVFNFDIDGKIQEYWEYFDPIVAGTGFGLAEVSYLPPSGTVPEDTGRTEASVLDMVVRARNGPPRGRVQVEVEDMEVHLHFTPDGNGAG